MPVGVPLSGGFAVTVTATTTGWPNGAGLGDAVAVVVVESRTIRFR